jgi:uncharacterized protein YbjT (DUF2867 family)
MKVLIFGASGSAGGSVLRACLASADVVEARAITRRILPLVNDKLRVSEHRDYLDFAAIQETFAGVDACLFCIGISVTQVSGEDEYRKITRDFAIAAAQALRIGSPNAIFHFISGKGTDSNSRFMWARVKAEAERELIARFDAVCWRPAAIDGERSASAPSMYAVFRLLIPLLRPFPTLYVRGEELGRAMLQATRENMRARIIENAEIREIAKRS